MGIASLHPSYALLRPTLRSIRGHAGLWITRSPLHLAAQSQDGWSESDTHRWLPRSDGYRFAPPILRSTLRSIRGMLACGSHDPRCTWPRSRRMGGAKAIPIDGFREVMGIASLHPSYALRCAASGACWPVEHTIPATPGRAVVGWVERSETHRWLPRGDGYRFAPPILRFTTLYAAQHPWACWPVDHTIPAAPGRAVAGWVERKRYPSMASEK